MSMGAFVEVGTRPRPEASGPAERTTRSPVFNSPRPSAPGGQRAPHHDPSVRELPSPRGLVGPHVSSSTPPAIRLAHSIGSPLAPRERERVTPLVDFDPVSVRVHTGEQAERAAAALDAAAFTIGPHVFFARGRFSPETPGGRALLVHELVHVRQFPGGRAPSAKLSPAVHDTLEREAQAVARQQPAPGRHASAELPAVFAPPELGGRGSEAVVALRQPQSEEPPATGAAGPAPSETVRTVAPPPDVPDVRTLADDVYQLLERRLRIERERTGVLRWR